MVERAFVALEFRFRILDQKSFHTFSTQVSLDLACCILHNRILGWGIGSFFLEEHEVMHGGNDDGHGVAGSDNIAWKSKRQE
jgi:hypothetical protein